MATTPLRGMKCPDRVLIPTNEAHLLSAISSIATSREYSNIRKSIITIQQKLNVAMYQAALMTELDPKDFTLFGLFRDPATRDVKFSLARYKICSYSMGNIDEYLLALTFFIDTFAATVFSLFDVSGALINHLYKLAINEDRTSFFTALTELQRQGQIDPNDNVFRLLCSYSLSPREPAYKSTIPLYNVTWLRPIKNIRHRTTHRPINDICDFALRGDVQSVLSGHSEDVPETEFFLNESLYPGKKLCDFVREVFDGIEEFVEDLYFYLREAVQRSSSLPIY